MIAMRNEKGFTLVELMVALVLGLLVTAAVLSVYISNRQTFRTAENMARLQENARFAFEALAREIREAGGNRCGAKRVANDVLDNNGGGRWTWENGPIKGYDGNQAGPKDFGGKSSDRVNGTDGILLISVLPDAKGDFGMVCNDDGSATLTLIKEQNSGTDSKYSYRASFWYIGNNQRDGKSLYWFGPKKDDKGGFIEQADEIVEGVTDMQIEYLERDASGNLESTYTDASKVSDWNRVIAVRLTLDLETPEKVGADNQPIKRTFKYVIGVRNRL